MSTTRTSVAEKNLQVSPSADPGFNAFTKNAYRVLGLTGIATSAMVAKSVAGFKRASKLGKQKESEWDLPWLGNPPRSLADIQTAEMRLNDPESRLLERMLWFHDPTLDTETVAEQIEHWDASPKPWAGHDAAVLQTITACVTDPFFKSKVAWADAVQRWSDLTADEKYWSVLSGLDHATGFEPCITQSEINALQRDCLKQVLKPVLIFAKNRLLAGDFDLVQRVFAVLSHESIPRTQRKNFEEELSRDFELTLNSKCEDFEDRCTKSLVREQNPSKSQKSQNITTCKSLRAMLTDEIEPVVQNVRKVFGEDADITRYAKSMFVDCQSALATAYSWADDLQQSEQLLTAAHELSKGTYSEVQIEEKLSSVKSQREMEPFSDEAVHAFSQNLEYTVTVSAQSLACPPVCTCCLIPTNSQTIVSSTREEQKLTGKVVHNRAFEMPLCNHCKEHASQLSGRILTIVILTCLSTFVSSAILQVFPTGYGWIFAVLGCIFYSWIWSAFIRVDKLHGHCARDIAVQMGHINSVETEFKFKNVFYAERFAKINDGRLEVRKCSKYSFGDFLFTGKSGRRLFFKSFFPTLIACCALLSGSSREADITQSQYQRSGSTANSNDALDATSQTPAPTKGAEAQTESSETEENAAATENAETSIEANHEILKAKITALNDKIERGRAQIKQLDLNISQAQIAISQTKTALSAAKDEVKGFEAQVDQGVEVDKTAYQQALDKHNALVRKYNGMLEVTQSACKQYKQMLRTDSAMVQQYNSMIRQR